MQSILTNGHEQLCSEQFDSVPERIGDMAAPHAGDVLIFGDADSRSAQPCNKRVVADATQRRMGLARGTKIFFDAEMDLNSSTRKPTSAASCELHGLRKLCHSQQVAIKGARTVFFTTRHGELNVIDGAEWRFGQGDPKVARG